MDEVEALARAYCRERVPPLDPDSTVGLMPDEFGPAWQLFADDAREHLAWARAMEAVKRDE